MCVQDRELQPTPIYKANTHTHTQGLSYVNISLKFPPLCIRHPKVFLSPFSSSHVGNFQDCSGCFFFYCHYHSRAATRLKEARTLIKSSMLQCVIRLHHMTTTLTSNATKIHKHTHAHTFSTAYILSTFCCTLYIFSFLFVQPLRGTCMFDST